MVFSFLPAALDWSILPHFGVSVGCLEGVWEVSGGCFAHSKLCLGPIDAKSMAILKSCRDDQLSVIHFLPVAYFGLWPCCSVESVKYICLI